MTAAADTCSAANEKRSLSQKEEEVRALKLRKVALEQSMGDAILEKAKAILFHQTKIGDIRFAYHALLEARVLLVEAQSDIAHLKDKNSEIKQKLEEGEHALRLLETEVQKRKEEAASALAEVKAFPDGLVDQAMTAARGRTAE
jgi:structural maintenance of chromosomes protein 5